MRNLQQLFGIALLLVASCRTSASIPNADVTVYRAVIDTMFASSMAKSPTKVVALSDSTAASTLSTILPSFRDALYQVAASDSALVDNWAENNRLPHSLLPVIDSGTSGHNVPVVLVNSRERLAIMARLDSLIQVTTGPGSNRTDLYWSSFYQEFPNALGHLAVSAIGYNREHDRALLSVSYSCGGLCGEGRVILAERTTGRWRIVKTVTVSWS